MKEIVKRKYYTLKSRIVEVRNMKKAVKEVLDKKSSSDFDRIDTDEFYNNYPIYMRELYREMKADNY